MNSVKYQCQNHHQKPLQSLRESLDPSVSLMKMSGKRESHQLSAPVLETSGVTEPQNEPSAMQLFLAVNK